MAKNSTDLTPSWFNIEDYRYAGDLDERGWLGALGVRRNFRWWFEFLSKRENFLIDQEALWKEFQEESSREQIQAYSKGGDLSWRFPDLRGIGAVWEAPEALLHDPIEARKFVEFVFGSSDHHRLLWISLDAPDKTILADLEEWLARNRRETGRPVNIRGPKTLNTKITGDHFNSWNNYRVLACFDIEFWFQVFKGSEYKLTHALLCGIVKPDLAEKADPKEWGREAREALEKALKSVDMLAQQVKAAAAV